MHMSVHQTREKEVRGVVYINGIRRKAGRRKYRWEDRYDGAGLRR